MIDSELIVEVFDKQLLSRLFYSNPVCILTTPILLPSFAYANAMTISWLTPTDNQGGLFLSINQARNTCERLLCNPDGYFVMNIITSDCEQLLLDIGKVSGADVNKFELLSITSCIPGWKSLSSCEYSESKKDKTKRVQKNERINSIIKDLTAISCCVAHVICSIKEYQHPAVSVTNKSNQVYIFAQCEFAFVRSSYWSGKQLFPQLPNASPLISFLGSGLFIHMSNRCPEEETDNV